MIRQIGRRIKAMVRDAMGAASCCRLVFASVVLLAGCNNAPEQYVRISVIDATGSTNPDSTRPGPAAQIVRAATSQGLVRFDGKGAIIPGLAERWIVTDDGRSFIFRLRDARWENGDAVTADQVAQALRQALFRQRRGPMASDLSVIRDIRSMTGRVIEIRLLAPEPDLLNILAQPELGIRRNSSGTGPMLADRQQRWLALTSRAEGGEADQPIAKSRILYLRAESAALGIARFKARESELLLGGRFQQLPYLAVANLDSGTIQFDPVSGLFGLIFVEESWFLGDAQNREAIAMAIDRSQLLSSLNLGEWQYTTRLVPDSVDDYGSISPERWSDQSVDQRRAVARQRIRRWVDDHGPIAPLRIALPDGPGSRLLFARLKGDLASVGLDSVQVAMRADADLRLIDEVASYGIASWYLNQFSCLAQRVCNEDGDAMLAEAERAVDPDIRRHKLALAEAMITRANTFIPLGTPVRWSLARPGLSGFATTETGWHPLPELTTVPR